MAYTKAERQNLAIPRCALPPSPPVDENMEKITVWLANLREISRFAFNHTIIAKQMQYPINLIGSTP